MTAFAIEMTCTERTRVNTFDMLYSSLLDLFDCYTYVLFLLLNEVEIPRSS